VAADRDPPTIDLTAEETVGVSGERRGGELVLVEPPSEPSETAGRSDVDTWGRSERMRGLARTLFDPMYRHWFRAEWEGLERIPRRGGALLVANHAGAIPPDAPVIKITPARILTWSGAR